MKRRRKRAPRAPKIEPKIEPKVDAPAVARELHAVVTEGSAPLNPDPLPPAEGATPIEPTEPRETDSPTSSAADAAEAAAAGPTVDPVDEDLGGAPRAPDANPFGAALTPSSLVQVCDVALFVIVRAMCAAKRVPYTEDVAKLAKFTKAERADLEAMAPLAIPYLAKQFEKAPEWAGAAMFGASFLAVASSHVSAATAHAPVAAIVPDGE